MEKRLGKFHAHPSGVGSYSKVYKVTRRSDGKVYAMKKVTIALTGRPR